MKQDRNSSSSLYLFRSHSSIPSGELWDAHIVDLVECNKLCLKIAGLMYNGSDVSFKNKELQVAAANCVSASVNPSSAYDQGRLLCCRIPYPRVTCALLDVVTHIAKTPQDARCS